MVLKRMYGEGGSKGLREPANPGSPERIVVKPVNVCVKYCVSFHFYVNLNYFIPSLATSTTDKRMSVCPSHTA